MSDPLPELFNRFPLGSEPNYYEEGPFDRDCQCYHGLLFYFKIKASHVCCVCLPVTGDQSVLCLHFLLCPLVQFRHNLFLRFHAEITIYFKTDYSLL